MKKRVSISLLALLMVMMVTAQRARDEQQIIANTQLLSRTVFGTKDSLVLEKLFAATASYGHSHGNLQTREEAIRGVAKNKSTYTDTVVKDIRVIFGNKKTAIVRYLFDANEHKVDGKVSALHFSMMLVWIREKGGWKLFGRQAVARD